MTWQKFEDIEAWQLARAYFGAIHELIQASPINKNFALRDQMYSAAGSIMDNIAEGFERGSNGEFRNFLGYAKGSCGEVRSQLYRCMDMGFLTQVHFDTLKQKGDFIAGKIYRIIEYLNSSDIKGPRFL
jgi:four helix bundle protein